MTLHCELMVSKGVGCGLEWNPKNASLVMATSAEETGMSQASNDKI